MAIKSDAQLSQDCVPRQQGEGKQSDPGTPGCVPWYSETDNIENSREQICMSKVSTVGSSGVGRWRGG